MQQAADPTDAAPDWGEAPWRVDLAIPPAPPPAACDVAVIGAGFTGLSAAYHLARRGCRVVVLEAGRVGDGASGRTGGLALEGTANGPLPGVEACLAELAQLVDEANIACDLELGGCWEVAHGASRPPAGLAWRDGDAWLGVAQRIAGGTVDPGKLVAGLARAAGAAGATILEHTAARGIEAGAPLRIALDGATLCAAHAVVALNGYTAELLALPVALRAPLTLGLCTTPVDEATLTALGWADRTPFYTLDLPYLWGRCAPGGRLIFGAGLLFARGEQVRRVALRHPEGTAMLAHLEARVRALHPALAGVGITSRWGGPIAFRAGGVPLLGALPAAPRVLVTGAYAGHGVALSVRVGRLLASAIADGAALPAWGALS
jgi:gamma-glutamylputrescine oxidase